MPVGRRELSSFFEDLHAALLANDVWMDDVATLVGVVLQFVSGRPLLPSNRFEGVGKDAKLVVNTNLGMWGSLDAEGTLVAWQSRVQHLAGEGFLTLTTHGPTWRIGLGARLRDVLDLEERQ
jgi:hypothetical protein